MSPMTGPFRAFPEEGTCLTADNQSQVWVPRSLVSCTSELRRQRRPCGKNAPLRSKHVGCKNRRSPHSEAGFLFDFPGAFTIVSVFPPLNRPEDLLALPPASVCPNNLPCSAGEEQRERFQHVLLPAELAARGQVLEGKQIDMRRDREFQFHLY